MGVRFGMVSDRVVSVRLGCRCEICGYGWVSPVLPPILVVLVVFFFFLRQHWWMWVCAGGGCRCCCSCGC